MLLCTDCVLNVPSVVECCEVHSEMATHLLTAFSIVPVVAPKLNSLDFSKLTKRQDVVEDLEVRAGLLKRF